MHQQEIGKYLKKKKSSTSSSDKKSKHKHKYEWYKRYVGDGNGAYISVDVLKNNRKFHSLHKCEWEIFKLCKVCGKEWTERLWYTETEISEIVESAIEIPSIQLE